MENSPRASLSRNRTPDRHLATAYRCRTGGRGWLLNGTKRGRQCALRRLVSRLCRHRSCRLQPAPSGVTGFIVNMHADGVLLESVIRMFGHAGGDEGIIAFRTRSCPNDRSSVRRARDSPTHVRNIYRRLYNSARATGLAKWAVSKALNYAEERTTFGEPLIEIRQSRFHSPTRHGDSRGPSDGARHRSRAR